MVTMVLCAVRTVGSPVLPFLLNIFPVSPRFLRVNVSGVKLCCKPRNRIVDEVEAVVRLVLRVDLVMLLLTHVRLKQRAVAKRLLAINALQQVYAGLMFGDKKRMGFPVDRATNIL